VPTEDERVIEDLGRWDWSLVVTGDGDVVARQPIKHDGVLVLSTASRPTSPRKTSQFGLNPERVVQQYAERSNTNRTLQELGSSVSAARGLSEQQEANL
jgi:hypothetical protein